MPVLTRKPITASAMLIFGCLFAGSSGVMANTATNEQSWQSFDICYDFGCRNQARVSLVDADWLQITNLLDAKDPADERQQIKKAIAVMEQIVGQYTPTHRDVAYNLPVTSGSSDDLFPGQLDCIDESLNTTRYLTLFQQAGLLKFHQVTERVYRRSFLYQHWAAQIRDTATGKLWVLDSWFENNGEPPVLVSAARWHDLSL